MAGERVAETVDENGQSAEEEGCQLSLVAQRLRRLKDSAVDAAHARERLPQPLFWSLFFSEVGEIRVEKDRERCRRRLIFGDTIL